MKNWNNIKKSIIINYKTWIFLLISSYLVCDYKILSGIFNYILGILYIYFGHRYYHSPYSTTYYYIHTYHHDHTDNNSVLFEIIMEFTGTMMPIIVLYCLFNFQKIIEGFNPYVYLFFALFYSTVHIINYTYLRINDMHMKHHTNISGNYFPDICDLIFDTKHEPDDVENTDHWLPNIIAVTLIVLLTKTFFRNSSNQKLLKLKGFIVYGLMYDSVLFFTLYYMLKDLFKFDKNIDKDFCNNFENIKDKLIYGQY